MDYIAACIDLYSAMCVGRCKEGIVIVRERIGITNEILLTIAEADTKEQEGAAIHTKLKGPFLNLARCIFLDYSPYNEWSHDNKIRCFFWNELKVAEPHQTIYRWEKSKYGKVESLN